MASEISRLLIRAVWGRYSKSHPIMKTGLSAIRTEYIDDLPDNCMENPIEVASIVKSFGKIVALNKVNYSSAKGINMILGPNGAGKSTFLRCIDGLYAVDSGSVRIFGENPYKNTQTKNMISLLTDNYALYDFLTVADNLKFFGRLYGMKDREILEAGKKMLRSLDAAQYLHRRVSELSRGTKQKVAFCRATLNKPDVLLLDEPTAFLDAHSAEAMRKILIEYEREGKTILFVTQKLDEVTRFNGKIAIIKAGKLVKETSTEGLYNMVLKNTTVNVRLARPLDIKIVKRIDGFIEPNSKTPTMLKFMVNDYRQINRIISSLMADGASIVSVDYIEHLIDDLSG
jgi:ABC-type multidrug transport system ATPase subunit